MSLWMTLWACTAVEEKMETVMVNAGKVWYNGAVNAC